MLKLYQKSIFYFLLVVISSFGTAMAQQEVFIYGEVKLVNGEKYKGKIYWSGGQRMWVDMLTVEKKDNPVLKYLNNEELQKLSEEEKEKEMDWGFMNLWKNSYPSRKLPLRCRFGDINYLEIIGPQEAVIGLKNGEALRVYTTEDLEYKNQLGKRISIYNSEKQKITFDWNKIAIIKFLPTPSQLPQSNIVPLYGTVLTRSGFTYTGLIKWDMDEHLRSNYIDGLTEDDKNKRFRFMNIYSIRPKDHGALIKLRTGAEVFLHGNSNVNNKNQGIVVSTPDWGRVIIRWRDFKEASFLPYPENSDFGYNAFKKGNPLKGQVRTTDNETWEGPLIYDLDEKLDIETLDGWDKAGALRQVPFGFISKVYPVSSERSAVILKDGNKLVLGNRSDVTKKNWGIMVFLPQERYQYIPWNKISWVSFD